MNAHIKALWLKDLRSGEFVQGFAQLRRSDYLGRYVMTYCCLGILCDIAARNQVDTWGDDNNFGLHHNTSVLSPKVKDWAGLPDTNPDVIYNGRRVPLAILNDDYHLDFNQIADIIEEQL